jgi:hypothetical protein
MPWRFFYVCRDICGNLTPTTLDLRACAFVSVVHLQRENEDCIRKQKFPVLNDVGVKNARY